MRKTSIRWDEQEKEIIAAQVARLRIMNLDATMTELVNEAQAALPEGRRRAKINSYKIVRGLETLVRQQVRVMAEVEEEEDDEDILQALTVGDLFETLLDRIIEKMVDRLQSKITLSTETHTVQTTKEHLNIETGKRAPKKNVPIIGIGGCFRPNFRAIERKVKHLDIELRYYDTDKDKPLVAPSVQYFICIPNKMPHTWQLYIKDRFKDNGYIVRGRVNQAVKVIEDLANSGVSRLHF